MMYPDERVVHCFVSLMRFTAGRIVSPSIRCAHRTRNKRSTSGTVGPCLGHMSIEMTYSISVSLNSAINSVRASTELFSSMDSRQRCPRLKETKITDMTEYYYGRTSHGNFLPSLPLTIDRIACPLYTDDGLFDGRASGDASNIQRPGISLDGLLATLALTALDIEGAHHPIHQYEVLHRHQPWISSFCPPFC